MEQAKAAYAEQGAEVRRQYEAEPVLLLHGGYTNLAVWDDHTEAFAAQYKVIRYDQRLRHER
ncbi:hypothetical protein L5D93_11250 [Paenibacillus thiaminolyticus]|nr:hypothetical protein [Paenibacillus thiaminolyticus]